MDDSNLLRIREPRCSACRLAPEALAALHRNRFEDMLTFEELALKNGLSDSSIRRHLRRHALAPEKGSVAEPANLDAETDPDTLPPNGSAGDDLDSHALLQAGVKTLGEMVQALANEYRVAVQQHPQVAERAFTKFMKAQSELAKSVKQLEAGRTVRDEFRKTVPRLVERVTTEAVGSIATLMREIGKRLREDFTSVCDERLSLDEFWNRLMQYENAWPIEIGTRMKAATKAALTVEDARVQEKR